MSLERMKLIGVAVLCIVLTLAVRRSLAESPRNTAGQSVRPVSSMEESGTVWTIPVEIVETGEAPRLHRVTLRN